MPRVDAWSSHGDPTAESARDPGTDNAPGQAPPSDEPPAVIRLDPAGPPSIQQRARDASLYLTRDNPLTFVSEESDARRLASTSRWLTVSAVGLAEITEMYGDDAETLIPSSYLARSDLDPEDDEAVETSPGPDIDPGAPVDVEQTYARADLEAMAWDELRSLGTASDRITVSGQTSRADLVDALSATDTETDRLIDGDGDGDGDGSA